MSKSTKKKKWKGDGLRIKSVANQPYYTLETKFQANLQDKKSTKISTLPKASK